MKATFGIVNTLMILLAGAASAQAQNTWKVDSAHSFVVFEIQHMELVNAWGRFNDPAGTIVWDAADPAKSKLEITLQAAKVDTGVKKRDDHLRSPDFFNVKEFPTISFKSTSLTKKSDNEYEVAGEMTLHGVTKPITVPLKWMGEKETQQGHKVGFQTSFTIKRSDFGMSFMVGPLGDEVTIHASLECARQ